MDTPTLIADLLGSWFTGNLDIVLQFGLSAAGPKCKYTSVLQSKCNQLTTRVYWQYLQCDIHCWKTLKIDLILLLTLLFSELLLNSWRGVGWGKAVPKLWLYNNILGHSKTRSMGCYCVTSQSLLGINTEGGRGTLGFPPPPPNWGKLKYTFQKIGFM